MQRLLVLLLFSCCLAVTYAQESVDKLIPLEELKEDFKILRTNLEIVHPGLYQYTSKTMLDSIFNTLESNLTQSLSSIDFYRHLLPLLRPIGNNHTNIEPPSSYVEMLQKEALRFTFRFHLRKDSVFILEDVSDEYIIKEGTLIQRINGEDALKLLYRIADFRDTDGYNYSFPLLSATMGFSRRYALFFGTPSSFDIEYIDQKGASRKVTIKAIAVDKIIANRKERYQDRPLFVTADSGFEIKDQVGLLTIPTFQPEGVKASLTYVRLLKKSFRELHKYNIQHLILDIRGNGGGFPEAAYKLMSYLINQPFYPIKYEYANVKTVPTPEYYEKDLFFKHFKKQNLIKNGQRYLVKNASKIKIKPKSSAFQGQLYVLTDARCASATGELTGHLRSRTNAIFIGEEPGGNPVTQAAGDLLHLVLPHSKLQVQIPALRAHSNVTFDDTGYGILPDYEILPTIENQLMQRDTVMLWTMQFIKVN